MTPGRAERRRANVFGEAARLYDRARPSYPEAIVDRVLQSVDNPRRLVEAGAGTGKATRLFAARGLTITAIEPDARMAALCRENLASWPASEVRPGPFEEATLTRGAYDLGMSAQAWHWVDPIEGAARMAAAIRPAGTLALMWNRPRPDDDEVRSAIGAVYRELAPTLTGPENLLSPHDIATSHLEPLTDCFDGPDQHDFEWVQRYTAVEFAELTRTHSPQLMLPDDQRALLIEAIVAAINEAGAGVYDYRYVTTLMLFRRR